MKKNLYIALILASVVAVSCSEDDVTANLMDTTAPFLPASDDQSEEAQLRRDFYRDYSSFLLFNDTLQHYPLGRDVNGDIYYFTEVLDLNYQVGMSTAVTEKFSYTLLDDDANKQIAVQYLRDYLLVHLTGKMKPYSWLLVDKIQRNFSGTISSPYAAAGQRAVVVACNILPRLSDSQKVQYTTQVMNTIIAQLALDQAEAFAEFLRISSSNYNGTFSKPATRAENTRRLNEAGFVSRGTTDLNQEEDGLYPSQEQDIKAFSRLVAANSAETLAARYADYPLVAQKCVIMRETLTSLGYVE